MALVKISDLPQNVLLAPAMQIPTNNAGVNEKITVSQLVQSNMIENLEITNTSSVITVKAGLVINTTSGVYQLSGDSSPSLATVAAAIGTGYGWCAVCINETTGAISVQLLGAGVPAFAAASHLGFAIGATKDTENQLSLNGKYDNSRGYIRSQINGTGDYYRIIAIFKLTKTFTDNSVVTTNGSASCTCTSTAKFTIGQLISGTNIPANSKIISITNATTFLINNPATGNATITATIANNIQEIIPILKRPKTIIRMANQSSQTLTSEVAVYFNGAGQRIVFIYYKNNIINKKHYFGNESMSTNTLTVPIHFPFYDNLSAGDTIKLNANYFSVSGTIFGTYNPNTTCFDIMGEN